MTRALSKIRATSLPRRGLSREEAAMYLGVPPETFDLYVRQGRIERPRVAGPHRLWDARFLEIENKFSHG